MLTAFDVGVGILVLISAILATARGLTREILSLATWAGSAAIAAYLFFFHPDLLNPYFADELISKIVLVAASFLVSLIVLHLITMKIADWVVDSKIGPLDRTLGFVFGVIRGLFIGIVFVIFAGSLLGFDRQPWAAEAKSWPVLRDWGDQLVNALPPDLEKLATDFLQRGRTNPDEDSPNETAVPDPAPGGDTPDDPPATPGTQT